MADENVSEFIRELQGLIDEVWRKPPADIKNVKEEPSKVALMRTFPKVNFGFHVLNELSCTLGVLRTCAGNHVSIDSIKVVTAAILENRSIITEVCGFTDTTRLMRRASKVIEQIQNAQEYMNIVGKLNIYLGKMSEKGWLDLEMHWSELSSAYDIIDSLISRTK